VISFTFGLAFGLTGDPVGTTESVATGQAQPVASQASNGCRGL
jgi:hypothetical protein